MDEDDQTLAVDDLVDFLTARTDPEDPMLAVTGLEEFFSARQTDDLETFVRKLEVVVTEALLPRAAMSDSGAPEAPGDPGDAGDREDDGARTSSGPKFDAPPWSFSTSPKRSTPSRANATIEGPIETQ